MSQYGAEAYARKGWDGTDIFLPLLQRHTNKKVHIT